MLPTQLALVRKKNERRVPGPLRPSAEKNDQRRKGKKKEMSSASPSCQVGTQKFSAAWQQNERGQKKKHTGQRVPQVGQHVKRKRRRTTTGPTTSGITSRRKKREKRQIGEKTELGVDEFPTCARPKKEGKPKNNRPARPHCVSRREVSAGGELKDWGKTRGTCSL